MLQKNSFPLAALLAVSMALAFATEVRAQDDPFAAELAQIEASIAAGELDAASAKLEAVRPQYESDPRFHVALATVYRQQQKMMDACDEAELAVRALEAAEQADQTALVRAAQSSVKRIADELLGIRQDAAKYIAEYRDKSFRLALKLSQGDQPEGAAFLLDELRFVMDPTLPALAVQRRRCDVEFAARPPDPAQADAVADADPIKAAERALRREPAKAFALAMGAWKQSPLQREPAVVAAEASVNMNRGNQAVALALLALNLDAESREARSLDRRLETVLRSQSRDLTGIPSLRDSIITKLIRVRKKAERANEAHNLAWMDDLLGRLAPNHPDVREIVGKTAAERLALRDRWLETHGMSADPADPDTGGAVFGDPNNPVDKLMMEGDDLLDRADELVGQTREENFDERKLKPTLEQALDLYEQALAKYRTAKELDPANRDIDQAITNANQQKFWTRKMMPVN